MVRPISIYFDCALFKHSTQLTPLGVGVYCTIAGTPAPQYSFSEYVGEGSISEGEYVGLFKALKQAHRIIQHHRARGQKLPIITIYGDSQFVVNSFNGDCKTSEKFLDYRNSCLKVYSKIATQIKGVFWIPRESNEMADKLSKNALEPIYAKYGYKYDLVRQQWYKPITTK